MDVGAHPLLAGLAPGVRREASAQLRPVTAEPDELLLEEGTPGRTFLLITEGSVEVSLPGHTGPEVATVDAGGVVGELSALRGTARTADVVAVTRVGAYEGDATVLHHLLEVDPGFGAELCKLASGRLAGFAPVTEVAVKGGMRVHVRPMVPSDSRLQEQAESAFSARSMELRFFTSSPLPESQIRRLLDIDYINHFAWVVLAAEDDDTYLASARWVRCQDDHGSGELGFGVVDAHQGKGIASVLLGALAVSAGPNGIERFRAETRAENEPMRALLRNLGATWTRTSDGLVATEIPVPDPAALLGEDTIEPLAAAVRLLRTVPHGS